MPLDLVLPGRLQDIIIDPLNEAMIQLRIQPEPGARPPRERLPEPPVILLRQHLEIPAALQDQGRLRTCQKIVGRSFLPHLLEVVERQVPRELLFLRLLVAHLVEPPEFPAVECVLQPDDPAHERLAAPGLPELPEHDVFEAVRRPRHHDEAPHVRAFRVDPRREHSAHAVPENENPAVVDPGVFPEHLHGEDRVFDRLLLHGQASVPYHLEPVREAALVVAQRRDAVPRKALRQVLERRQLHHFFIHVARAGPVHHHDGRHRF